MLFSYLNGYNEVCISFFILEVVKHIVGKNK